MDAQAATKTVDKIGRYRVTGELGRGGMGIVYEGEDGQIGRRVAIKTLTDVTPELRERFHTEARSGILSHQNIVTVYEVGEHEGRPFIAMEFVEGDSLEKVLRLQKRLPLVEALSIAEQICAGLGHAHGNGVIHRDVKPGNVLLRPNGRVTIVDFGIARLADQSRPLTKTDTLVGTLHYIAPERLKGETSDGRADIWSVGVMLYEMVTGELPFNGSDVSSVYRVIHEPYVPVTVHVREVPEGLSRILDKALAKQVEERYATAEEMARDVHGLARDLIGVEANLTRGNGRTVQLRAPHGEQLKTHPAEELDETQEVPQTIPLRVVRESRDNVVPEHEDRQPAGSVETTSRKPPLESLHSHPPGSSAAARLKAQPGNASSVGEERSQKCEPKRTAANLQSDHRRLTEGQAAIEKAVAACNRAIEMNQLDDCMRPLADVANRYGESPLFAAAKQECRRKRSQRATQLLSDAMLTSLARLRGGSAKDAQRALKAVEFALPFADADAGREWQRLNGECAAGISAKRPRSAGLAPAKRRRIRWYAAGFIAGSAAVALGALSYHHHGAPPARALTAPAPLPANEILTDMEINASPWGRVVGVENESGVSVPMPESDLSTPLRMDGLKSGKYKVTLASADGIQQTVECNISPEVHLCSADLGTPVDEEVIMGGQQ